MKSITYLLLFCYIAIIGRYIMKKQKNSYKRLNNIIYSFNKYLFLLLLLMNIILIFMNVLIFSVESFINNIMIKKKLKY